MSFLHDTISGLCTEPGESNQRKFPAVFSFLMGKVGIEP